MAAQRHEKWTNPPFPQWRPELFQFPKEGFALPDQDQIPDMLPLVRSARRR